MTDEFHTTPVDYRRVDIPAFVRRLVRYYETTGIGDWRYAAEIIEQQAALRSLEADGWVCVPKIATEDMLSTGKIAAISTHRVDQVYESMVAASPRLTGDKP